MNMLWNIGEMAVLWAFPQVGTTFQTVKWVNTAYKATKCGVAFFSGDVVGGMSAAASHTITCEAIRDQCIQTVMNEGTYIPSDAKEKGWKIVACWGSYWFCQIFK